MHIFLPIILGLFWFVRNKNRRNKCYISYMQKTIQTDYILESIPRSDNNFSSCSSIIVIFMYYRLGANTTVQLLCSGRFDTIFTMFQSYVSEHASFIEIYTSLVHFD